MAPSTMKAIKSTAVGKVEIKEVPLPKLRDDYILVKVKAVALNPTDWKHIHVEGFAKPGSTSGCDFAGIVEEVGSKVTKPFKKGDRICGWTHGMSGNPENGSFAEYAVVKGDVFIKTPDNLSDEDASTLGIGITTVGQHLYQTLELPLPGSGSSYDKPILIYGASTATGTLAVQYAKLSGAKVIATCSPHNFELVKSLGAEEAFDYNDPDCAKKIREYTNDSLEAVLDCIGEGQSLKICEEAVSSKGGVITALLRVKHERKDIRTEGKLGYTVFGEPFVWLGGQHVPALPEDLAFGSKFWDLSAKLLADGTIKVHPAEVREGGLQGVLQGLEDLKNGKVSGVKLVYKI